MKNLPGKISKVGDDYQVVFERVFHHPAEKVWNAITDPGELKYWFTDIDQDLRPGGTLVFRFRDADRSESYGSIVSIDPLHQLEWTWEGEPAEWALEQQGEATKLKFTYSKMLVEQALGTAAGFHTLLNRLEDRLNGSSTTYPFGTEENDPEQQRLRIQYAAAIFESYPEIVRHPPVVVQATLYAGVEEVWQALTDKNRMKEWYFDVDDFRAEEGFRFTFPGQGHKGAKFVHQCTVTEVIPYQKLQYSWQYENTPGYSLVTFGFHGSGHTTTVKLTHHGIESFPQNSDDFAWKSFEGGWNEIIRKMLPKFLAKK
ncbi:hypothetical protein GCM10023091_20390 [Ravibacter arvi]|uniref:Activator of Hsp90 ATPase homologue 1/2-like C-terminal domain-containing protein n=1 Tax=Ravibacter arvi TaxID=2051041 RepID=A0ABP8LYK7_9BACT